MMRRKRRKFWVWIIKVISIEPTFEVFLQTLEREFANTEVDTTEENIQARCRGVILMALSNKLASYGVNHG